MTLKYELCGVSELPNGNKFLVPTGKTFYPAHPLLASFLSSLPDSSTGVFWVHFPNNFLLNPCSLSYGGTQAPPKLVGTELA